MKSILLKIKTLLRLIKTIKFNSISYSQEGEDLILQRFFGDKKNGFYVDIGAHHPIRFSNTYLFYLKGWRGINIDAMPGSMKKFNKKRKRDINLEIPVSDKNEKLVYYSFNEPALNGFSKELSNERNNINSYRITSEIEMVTKTMEQILDEHLPKEQKIDFLSIDVEGLDFQVLKSNNWGKYKPNFILIEILDYYDKDISSINKSKVYNFLFDKGYICVAKTFNTFFFKLF